MHSLHVSLAIGVLIALCYTTDAFVPQVTDACLFLAAPQRMRLLGPTHCPSLPRTSPVRMSSLGAGNGSGGNMTGKQRLSLSLLSCHKEQYMLAPFYHRVVTLRLQLNQVGVAEKATVMVRADQLQA